MLTGGAEGSREAMVAEATAAGWDERISSCCACGGVVPLRCIECPLGGCSLIYQEKATGTLNRVHCGHTRWSSGTTGFTEPRHAWVLITKDLPCEVGMFDGSASCLEGEMAECS